MTDETGEFRWREGPLLLVRFRRWRGRGDWRRACEHHRTTGSIGDCCVVWRRGEVYRAKDACGLFLPVGLTVKPVGEPDAGNRHVRFDERGWETERWP